MRIIAGKYKGKTFNSKLPTGIRPTQDAMRETIFNILNNYLEFNENIVVADICAGAGMLGIEALSRGSKFIYFVDKSVKSTGYIQNNLDSMNIEKHYYKILNLDALQFVNHWKSMHSNAENTNNKLDIIFIDPPYNTSITNDVLYYINEYDILNKDGVIVAETAVHNIVAIPESYSILTERQFGASKVTFITK